MEEQQWESRSGRVVEEWWETNGRVEEYQRKSGKIAVEEWWNSKGRVVGEHWESYGL